MSDNQMVLQSLDKGLLTITMNRPDRRNALNPEMTQGLVEAARRAQDDTEVRAVLIRGAGGTFCSGMDLKGFLKGERPSIPGRGFAGLTEAPPKKPLIAAVDALHARATLDDAEFAALSAHYDDDQVLEIILLCGFYRTVSYLANALALPLEATAARFPQ